MSIASDVTRIESAKAAIKAAIEGKGVTVPDATLLDGMAALIESIEAGGGEPPDGYTILTGHVTLAEDSANFDISSLLGFAPSTEKRWTFVMFSHSSGTNLRQYQVPYFDLTVFGSSRYLSKLGRYRTGAGNDKSFYVMYPTYNSGVVSFGSDYALIGGSQLMYVYLGEE